MGSKNLIYIKKVNDNIEECKIHLLRLNDAIQNLCKEFIFPLDLKQYKKILLSSQNISFTDQMIYRFSKLQDCMGAKLFKSVLLQQGENIDKPFIDILNNLEKINILNVDLWFELRDLRNEVTHQYENNAEKVVEILNGIYKQKNELEKIILNIEALTKK